MNPCPIDNNNYEYVFNNLQTLKEKINYLAKKFNRDPSDIKLLAVSKGQPIGKIEVLVKNGFLDFGENYLQELEEKYNTLKHYPIRWHYIGNLQSNKIKKLINIACEIQTVSSIKHVRYIARYAKEFNKIPYPIYIEINFAKEPQKSGINPEEGKTLVQEILQKYPELKLEGIMCVPPATYTDPPNVEEINFSIPQFYLNIKEYVNELGLNKLSLGMSSDIALAIAVGSTCLRIGTAIFGERTYT